MGWLWSSSDDSAKSPSSGDAYDKLDPSLRDFLDKQTPASQSPAQKPAQNEEPQKAYRHQLGITKEDEKVVETKQQEAPVVPQESLYQDGRYAHLWKTYTPLSAIEGTGRSDQDRLADIIDSFNERNAQIGRAAVENCIFEQLAEHECFRNGGLHAKMTMCRTENKAFNRCYQMQSRFLKALGYLATQRTEDEEERIQMHADKLYHEMLAREAAVAKAREEGLAEPVFAPLLNNDSVAGAMAGKPSTAATSSPTTQAIKDAQAHSQSQSQSQTQPQPQQIPQGLDMYSVEKRKELEQRLAGKSKDERDLEIQLIVAESQATSGYAAKINDYFQAEKEARADRKERGRETYGDTIKRLWGWDK